MKKLKLAFLTGLFCSLTCLTSYSQGSRSTWPPGSIQRYIIYDPVIDLPIKTTPTWDEFSVSPDKSIYKLSEGKLNIKTTANALFGYQLKGNSFLPKDTFTLNIKGENLSDTSAIGVNIRLTKGRNIKLNFKRGSIQDVKSNLTLASGLLTKDMTNYRIVVAKDEAALYRDFDFVSTLNIQAADTIKDGGFERMTSAEAADYWGHDGYTGVSVVTDQKHSGNKSMKWENGWNGRFMGVLKVQPNSSYTFTYWAKLIILSAWGQTQMNGGVWVDGQQVSNLPIQGDWSKYTCSFTTGPTVNQIEFNYHNGWTGDGNFAICFDDIQLTKTTGDPFLQIGNLYSTNTSDINIGKVSFLSGTAYKPVALSDLTQLLNDCQILLAGSQSGSGTGNFPAYAINRFSAAIQQSSQVVSGNAVTAESVDQSFAALQNANNLFKRSKIANGSIVLSSVSAIADVINLKSNDIAQISVKGVLSDITVVDLSIADISYTSLNPILLTVDLNGKVTALSPGNGKVEVAVQLNDVLLKDTVDFTIIEYNLASVDFSPYNAIVEIGEATGTRFNVKMTDGSIYENINTTPVYRSLTGLISINSNGSIIALRKGLAKVEIAVTLFGKTIKDTTDISVISFESITLTPTKSILVPNETSTYSISANFSDGSSIVIDNTNAVVWSKNRNVISIDDKGHIKADSVGSSDIQFKILRNAILKTSTVTLSVIKNSTGIYTIEQDLSKVYPLPFMNSLTVSSPKGIKNVRLTELSGKGVLSIPTNGENEKSINVSTLHPGIYMLILTDGLDRMSVSKVIKK